MINNIWKKNLNINKVFLYVPYTLLNKANIISIIGYIYSYVNKIEREQGKF